MLKCDSVSRAFLKTALQVTDTTAAAGWVQFQQIASVTRLTWINPHLNNQFKENSIRPQKHLLLIPLLLHFFMVKKMRKHDHMLLRVQCKTSGWINHFMLVKAGFPSLKTICKKMPVNCHLKRTTRGFPYVLKTGPQGKTSSERIINDFWGYAKKKKICTFL